MIAPAFCCHVFPKLQHFSLCTQILFQKNFSSCLIGQDGGTNQLGKNAITLFANVRNKKWEGNYTTMPISFSV